VLAYRRIAGTALLDDIRSGYDVRLVETLHRQDILKFPADRRGLYDAIVSQLFPTDGQAADRLFAFAWTLWLGGKRRFTDDELDDAVRKALKSDPSGVTRIVEGAEREFRHDQMRGYLAAQHLVRAANPINVLEASEGDWPKGSSEQDLVWQFAAALVDEMTAQRMYKWALKEPENRIRLQVAFAPQQASRVA